MNNLYNWVLAHPFGALGIYYVFSAATGALQAPDATSSQFYRWLYSFANTLAANIARAYATKLPSGALNTATNAAKEPPVLTVPATPADTVQLPKP